MKNTEEYNRIIRQDMTLHSRQRGAELILKTTWGLFSPRAIDAGSQMLLDFMDLPADADCLDLGCGYGILGLTLARWAPEGETLLVDKDFVAVEYSEKNRLLNHIDNAACQLSNGFQHIPRDRHFDVIVSNIPAKVGKEMLYIYLFDALEYLKPGGSFYIVTITGLRQFFKRGFQEVFGHYEKIKQGKTYTVARGMKQA